jgi:multiple antibiotic resistance protein
MELAYFITAFTTLFVIIDPIGLTPIFVALTSGMTPSARRQIAVRACILAIFLLTLFALFGEALLGFVGISMPAFRIAGGILLFLTALDMLFERRTKRREDQVEDEPLDEGPDPSVFPLAIPLIAGPGAIASMILLTDGAIAMTEDTVAGNTLGVATVLLVMVVVVALVYLMFMAASAFERLLGKTGINVVTRLLGMLLAALSVQFVADGIRELSLIG